MNRLVRCLLFLGLTYAVFMATWCLFIRFTVPVGELTYEEQVKLRETAVAAGLLIPLTLLGLFAAYPKKTDTR